MDYSSPRLGFASYFQPVDPVAAFHGAEAHAGLNGGNCWAAYALEEDGMVIWRK
jgi:hypothetical protein